MTAKPPPPARPYLSNGQVLSSPPLGARIRSFFGDAQNFVGLYLSSLFALDASEGARQSSYSINNRGGSSRGSTRPSGRSGGGGGGGGGGSGGGFGRGGGGRKIGRVDDVRGPECGSCG